MSNRKAIVRKIMWALAGLALMGLAASCGGSSAEETPAEKDPAIRVEVQELQPAPLEDVMVLPGQTEADQDVLLAAERDGRVDWIGPKEGDRVKKGELIAKIDVAAAKAMLDRAEAAFRLADDAATRRQSLGRRKVIPQEELDRALTERMVAEGNLREARVHYEQGFVHSPISGVVNHLYLDEGEWADRGKPVAELVDESTLRINVSVPELDVRFLAKGNPVRVIIDAFQGRHWTGGIHFVAYKADPATKTFLVRVLVDNTDGTIRPGMIARVFFLRRVIPEAIAVPLTAILDKGGERIVFVVEDGVAKSRTIEIGVLAQDRVQVTKGLKAGDKLIVAGQTMVEDGIKVSLP